MHAPVSPEQLKDLKAAQEPAYTGDLSDPMLWKILPLILVAVGMAVAAVATQGFPVAITLILGATGAMFLIILRLTRGDV